VTHPDDLEPTPAPPHARRPILDAPYLARALAAFDGADPRSVARCRAAALRHAEALRAWDIGAGLALRLLRESAAIWMPDSVDPARRRELEQRMRFWVGTVYGVRWRSAPMGDHSLTDAELEATPDAPEPPLRGD
jgi:hypothetical protein